LIVSPNRQHVLRYRNSAAGIDTFKKIVVPGGHTTHRYYALGPVGATRNRLPATTEKKKPRN
jgi:hypothetical protein